MGSFFWRLGAFALAALALGGFDVKAASGLYDFNGYFQETHPFTVRNAPTPYGAPPQQYGAPPQQYGAPPQQYGAPPQQYGAPPQQYGAPPQQYGAPPQQYGDPSAQGWGGAPQYGASPVQAQAPGAPRFKFNDAPEAKPASEGWNGISEIRLGVLAHDEGPFSRRKEKGADVNLAILFNSPDFLGVIWSPRPQIGGNYSTSKDTSQAYLGIVWEWDFWENYFFGFGWGGAYHSGKTRTEERTRKELGCKFLFREDFDLGYKFNENHRLMLHFDHISNAKLCSTNEGLENIGIRYGYKF